jgi:hypothetical protein
MTGFVGSLGTAFGAALDPLRVALGSEDEFSDLLKSHGWEAPAGSFDIAAVRSLFAVDTHFAAFEQLYEQAASADAVQAVQLVLDAIDELKAVVDKVQKLALVIADQQAPFPFSESEFWSEFPGELVEDLFVGYLETYQSSLAVPLVFLGIIEHEEVTPGATGRVDYVRATIHWDRIPDLLNPQTLIDTVFVAETGEFLARRLIETVALGLLVDGLRGVLLTPEEAVVDAYYTSDNDARDDLQMLLLPLLGGDDEAGLPFDLGLTILPIPTQADGEPTGVAIGPAVFGAPAEVDLGMLDLAISGGFLDDRGLQVELRPGGVSVAPSLSDGVFAELTIGTSPSEPMVLIGSPDGHRLQAERFAVGIRAEGTPQGVEVRIDLSLDGVALLFDTSGSDEFTKRVAGDEEQQVGFSTGLTWSSRHGLTFRGHIGLTAHVPVTARFGPISLDSVTLGLTTADGTLALTAGANGSGRLGPITVVVQGLGLQFAARPIAQGDLPGNFGVLDVDWSVRAPDGYGLEIAVSDDIRGAGFLARDAATDRWIGAIDLKVNRFRFTGLVVTERDSLIGLLWFQGLKIPLFGGVITGVGVLVAYRRRSDRDAFLGAMKSGGLEALMFPADPIAQAPVLAANLVQLFPYDADRTVAGILARWVFGEAAELVVVDLGLLVEFTSSDLQKIIVVGRGRARVKDLSEEQFRLNVELYGEWDIGRGELIVLASLRDSRLVGGELSGDGMLYSGPLAGFILTVGGFNPRYQLPAQLPELRRLSARIIDSDNLKLGVELYFALTSSSIQFGVEAVIWAGVSGFSITGTFQLDALIRFDFSMVVDLEFSVTLRRGDTVLASISFTGVLEGVSPLKLDGKAKLEILFFSISVPVSLQIGDDGAVTQPEVDALEPLRQAMTAAENWISGGEAEMVLSQIEREGVWATPEGSLQMSQHVVPLEMELTRLGPSPLVRPQRFQVTDVDLAGPRNTDEVQAEFSPGVYKDLDLDESIGAPLTESLASGFELAADAAVAGVEVAGNADYEEFFVDAPVAEGSEEAPEMLMRTGDRPSRAPKTPYADERAFYKSPTGLLAVSERRFITVNDNLEPDGSHSTSTLLGGLTYTQAREIRGAAPESEFDRIVRRHEAVA